MPYKYITQIENKMGNEGRKIGIIGINRKKTTRTKIGKKKDIVIMLRMDKKVNKKDQSKI